MNGSKKKAIARRNVSKKIASRLRSAAQSEAAQQRNDSGTPELRTAKNGQKSKPAKRAKHQ